MSKKKHISQEDTKTWQNYIKDLKDITDKDSALKTHAPSNQRLKFDLHGFSLNEANDKVKELILYSVKEDYKEILLITGKGIHSKTDKDIYVSKDLSKLKYSVPDFINSDLDISCYVSSISEAGKNEGGEGAIIIKLKRL